MTDSIVWRLVWKEYRVLRGFWLCLAAFGVLSFALTSMLDTDSVRAGALAGIVVMLPVFYLLGSIAVAFAAEREDGTDQVLQRLGASRGRLWLSKLGFDVVSALLLFSLLWLVAHSFFSFSSFQVRQPGGETVDPTLSAIAWMVGFLAWGVFFSLVCRRVLSAVCLTVAASSLTPLVSDVAIQFVARLLPEAPSPMFGDQIDWTFRLLVLPALLLIESYRITRLWADDRRYRLPRWIDVLWRAVSVRVRPVKAMDRAAAVATAIGSAVAISRPLVRESVSPWRREFKPLAWLEWRTARWVTLAVLSVLGCLLAFTQPRHTDDESHGLFMSLVVLAPAVFGLWSYTGEQKGHQFRWLTDQGLSPVQVWSIKHVVWLSAAIATMLAATVVASANGFRVAPVTLSAAGWQGVPWPRSFAESFEQFFAAIAHLPVRIDPADRLRLIVPTLSESAPRCLLLVCLSYTVGHFVSILIPRAITATFITLIAWAGMFVWWLAMNAMQIPLVGSVVRWLPTLLLATGLFVTDWMPDRRSWRVWLKPFGVCIAGFALIASYSIWFRVTEITLPPRLTELLPRLNASASSATLDSGPLFDAGRRTTLPPDQRGLHVRQSHPFLEPSPVFHLEWRPIQPAWHEWLVRNRESLRLSIEMLRSSRGFASPSATESHPLYSPQTFSNLNAISLLLAVSAWQLETDDRLTEAFDRHLLNLRWAGMCSRNAGQRQAEYSLSMIDLAIFGLAGWAAHPKHTADTLNSAMARFYTFMLLHHAAEQSDAPWKDFFAGKIEAKPPLWRLERIGAPDERQPVPLAATRTFLKTDGSRVVAATHDHRHPLLPDLLDVIVADHRTLLTEIQQDTTSAAINTSRRLFPWERVRERQLADFLAVEALDDIGGVPLPFPRVNLAAEFHRRGWDRQREVFPESSSAAQWVRTTPSARQVQLFYGNLHLLPQLVAHRIDAETRLRAVTLMLALAAFKLEHGAYPERLADLSPAVRWAVETDPWMGRDFGYEPHGFAVPLAAKSLTLPEKQPFLQSAGLTGFPVQDPSATNQQRANAATDFRSGWATDVAPSSPRDPLQSVHRSPLVFPLP